MKCNQNIITLIIIITIMLGTLIFISYKNNKKIQEKFDNPVNTLSSQEQQIDNNNIIISNKLNNLSTYLSSINNNIVNNDINTETNLSNLVSRDLQNYSQSISNSINPNTNLSIINNLQNQITDLENIVAIKQNKNFTKPKYTKIKSLNNGLELNLIQTPDIYYNEYSTGSNVSANMVSINCGCLSVGSNDYNVYQCNDKDIKQYFKLETIFDKTSYQNNIDVINPISGISETDINYPFTMIKSVNNGNCLTNNQGSITVQPCSSFKAQRWITM